MEGERGIDCTGNLQKKRLVSSNVPFFSVPHNSAFLLWLNPADTLYHKYLLQNSSLPNSQFIPVSKTVGFCLFLFFFLGSSSTIGPLCSNVPLLQGFFFSLAPSETFSPGPCCPASAAHPPPFPSRLILLAWPQNLPSFLPCLFPHPIPGGFVLAAASGVSSFL